MPFNDGRPCLQKVHLALRGEFIFEAHTQFYQMAKLLVQS